VKGYTDAEKGGKRRGEKGEAGGFQGPTEGAKDVTRTFDMNAIRKGKPTTLPKDGEDRLSESRKQEKMVGGKGWKDLTPPMWEECGELAKVLRVRAEETRNLKDDRPRQEKMAGNHVKIG